MGRKKNKLVFGWGANDADYEIARSETIDGKQKIVWTCPYYRKWCSILMRCFDPKFQTKQPTYKGCTVSEDWKCLSNFIKWVDGQPNKNWVNSELDKDLLFDGNKHYSAETVVFVNKQINLFITNSGNVRGKHMVGVYFSPMSTKNPYVARCYNPFGGSRHIGHYQTELEAHKAWQAKKHEYACMLADMQDDERIASRLRDMYAPDKDWTNK